MSDQPVPQAILSDEEKDWRVDLSMLFGSFLEGGWGPTYGAGDGGWSTGPYQINKSKGMHADITRAQTQDPVYATRYMLNEYRRGVSLVPNELWTSNPMGAAELAAYKAERPAQIYHDARGWDTVRNAYAKAKAALDAGPGGGGPAVGGGGGSGGATPPATDVGFSIPIPKIPGLGGLTDGIGDLAKNIALVVLGILAIIVGLVVVASAGKDTPAGQAVAAKGKEAAIASA